METRGAPDSLEVDFPLLSRSRFHANQVIHTAPSARLPGRDSKARAQIALKIRRGEQSGVAV